MQKKMLMKGWICALLFWLPFGVSAQAGFSGSWQGYLTQGKGGYASKYDFELYLIQRGDKVTGRSYVRLGRVFAVMELKGQISGGDVLHFTETRLVDYWKPEDIEWCYKKASLRLTVKGKNWQLEGPWTGHTGDDECVPGVIVLSKQVPRV